MMTCQEVAELVDRSLDEKLPWTQRWVVRLHLLYCKACVRYRRHVRTMRRLIREEVSATPDAAAPDATRPATCETLPPPARQRIIETLEKHA